MRILLAYATLSYGLGLFACFHPQMRLYYPSSFLLFGLPLLLLLIHMFVQIRLQTDAAERRRVTRISMWALLSLYCVAILTLLFFNRIQQDSAWQYGTSFINPVPFKTVWDFLTCGNFFIAGVNIGGNLLLLMPLGVFIPFLFGKLIRKFWQFLLLILGMVILIECIQYLVHVGSADVDDVILNTLGACLVFWIYTKQRARLLTGTEN
ncbi:MAG: VanZ family protein [Clostridiales bacterium]|nr:VanZ family protein [Clostridiales bacterium]